MRRRNRLTGGIELHQLRLLHPLPPLATGRCKSGDRWSSVAARCAVSFSSICSIELAYTLWSPYTIYYAFSMFGQILLCLSAVYQIFQKGVQLGSMFHFIFYGSNLAAALILARNAYNWPLLIKSIEEIENQLPYFRRNFRTIITLTTALMLANCAVEHILFVAHGLIIAYSCDPDNVIDIYLKLYKASIYEFTRGSAWRWVVTEIFTLQGSFNYSYNDFIMVLVSLYLSEYFLVHNKRLKKAVQQVQRYIDQVKTIKIAISGLDFFYVTRGTILTELEHSIIDFSCDKCLGHELYTIVRLPLHLKDESQ
ncbi:unnamed protein product [Arctia plantaginis]|uniref:Gustatory receptor n=1 Tax=Arctia plantaginis TaxID=874455 RepID=A0A8S0YP58_ARCPL|nr:unnamed protein product [Arctia plantaginis]